MSISNHTSEQQSLITDIKLLNQQTTNQNRLPKYTDSKRSLKGLNNLLQKKLNAHKNIQDPSTTQNYLQSSYYQKPHQKNVDFLSQIQQNQQLFKHIKDDLENVENSYFQIKQKYVKKEINQQMGWESVNKITPQNTQEYFKQSHRNWISSNLNHKNMTRYGKNRQYLKNQFVSQFFDQTPIHEESDLSSQLQEMSLSKSSSSLVYNKDYLQIVNQIEKQDKENGQNHKISQKFIQILQQSTKSPLQPSDLQELLDLISKSSNYPLWGYIDFIFQQKSTQISDFHLNAILYLQKIFREQNQITSITEMVRQTNTGNLKAILEKRFSFLQDDFYSQDFESQYMYGYFFLLLRSFNTIKNDENTDQYKEIDEFLTLFMDNDPIQDNEVNLRNYWENYINNNINENRQQFYIQNNTSNYIKNHYFLHQTLNILCKQPSIITEDFITEDDDYLWMWLNIVQIEDDKQEKQQSSKIQQQDEEKLTRSEFQELIRNYIMNEKDTISDETQILYEALTEDLKGLLKHSIDYLEPLNQEYEIIWILYFLLKIEYISFNQIPYYLQSLYRTYIKKSQNKLQQQELSLTANLDLQTVLNTKYSNVSHISRISSCEKRDNCYSKGATYTLIDQHLLREKQLNRNLQRNTIFVGKNDSSQKIYELEEPNENENQGKSQHFSQLKNKSLFQKKEITL